jgi:hypothetical protein
MSQVSPQSNLETRYWCVSLLAAMEVAGFVPAKRARIHALFFLTNALAPAYGDSPQIGMVMNHPRGPYYPEVDWHLARLSVQMVLKVSNLRFYRDAHGPWASSDFRITEHGAAQIAVLKAITLWQKRIEFLSDVTRGLARLDNECIDPAVRADDTYERPGAKYRDVYAFGIGESNYTIRRLSRLRAAAPHGLPFSRQDLIRTYARLLNLQAS